MVRFIMPVIFLICCFMGRAQQEGLVSIHQLQQEYYKKWDTMPERFFDSVNVLAPVTTCRLTDTLTGKRVFGYHPYWGGSNYLNYQWNLLSDLCFFSYEVNPSTGHPFTIHGWDTSPAIDSALANQVKVHLCVTLFSGHSAFFGNPSARQTLINNIIDLIGSRGAHGVNLDIEALPSSQSASFTDFVIDLNTQMNLALPEAELSLASPAVNWSNKFNLPILKDHVDFFMVMAYDYYWSGSGEAGPVSPLYAMTGAYNYSFSRTISYYQSQGVTQEQLILGVPYYAYQWPTEGPTAPSLTTGQGSAYTWANIMGNPSGNYIPANKHLEPNSLSPYYSFQSGGWYQCFLDDVRSLGKKFDIINRRGLSGAGIWALGYDNGFTDLWELIGQKFGSGKEPVGADTIYDSGGPTFDYYDHESYLYSIITPENTQVYLAFSYLATETGYDTLKIYDGSDVQSPLIGQFTGDTTPALSVGTGNIITLAFTSDAAFSARGWRAVFDTIPVSSIIGRPGLPAFTVYPNPATHVLNIKAGTGLIPKGISCKILDAGGRRILQQAIPEGSHEVAINLEGFPSGIFFLELIVENQYLGVFKFMIIPHD